MTAPKLGVIESGAFPVRRYRLSTAVSSVSVLALATATARWVEDRFRLVFTYGPESHVTTTNWLSDHSLGEWVTVEGWVSPEMPPIPTDGLWTVFKARVRLGQASTEGFSGYRDHTPGPGYLVTRTAPPTTTATVPIRAG